ncbi:response regulator transcription factor [Motiliproteus sp. SC1-56]|uniref:response regulator transcription factor n=1 Tax=Motiliproteus sp. SC1-56 TaxID=2799565 RepID=UPI001A8D73BD|nr:response regulator transcription factor [Motiliproteus sp. SC1-56]
MNVLLVVKDSALESMLGRFAKAHHWSLKTAPNGEAAQILCRNFRPHVILQDSDSLYTASGHLVRQISDENDIPSLLLVPPDKVRQFTGYVLNDFDEFLIKPFDVDEMNARIRLAMVKHREPAMQPIPVASEPASEEQELEFGPFCFDPDQKRIFAFDTPLKLTPKQYLLLYTLLESHGRLLSCKEIIEHLWPDSQRAAANDVQQYIHQLRRKLGAAGLSDQCIRNEKGFGYGLACPSCDKTNCSKGEQA